MIEAQIIDAQTLDAEIARMYTTGESTMAISKRLGMRPAEVISRVRALNLVPPGMGFRRPSLDEHAAGASRIPDSDLPRAASRPSQVADHAPRQEAAHRSASGGMRPPRAHHPVDGDECLEAPVAAITAKVTKAKRAAARLVEEKPCARRAVAGVTLEPAALDDEAEDCSALATLPGRPRGWLVTEGEMAAIFSRPRGRFEDVRLRKAGG